MVTLVEPRARRLGLAVAAVIAAGAASQPAEAGGQQRLARLEAAISREHATIDHIAPEGLASLLEVPGRVLVIDVREETEYRIGHIEGAIRVSPDEPADAVIARIGPLVRGKVVVAYCAVGLRSSRLVERMHQMLVGAGAVSVANLIGGAFAWHNTGRPLVNATGATEALHPWSPFWRRYLDFNHLAVTR